MYTVHQEKQLEKKKVNGDQEGYLANPRTSVWFMKSPRRDALLGGAELNRAIQESVLFVLNSALITFVANPKLYGKELVAITGVKAGQRGGKQHESQRPIVKVRFEQNYGKGAKRNKIHGASSQPLSHGGFFTSSSCGGGDLRLFCANASPFP
eukprot:1152162-Pelagomonas_calceolata.AAC.3